MTTEKETNNNKLCSHKVMFDPTCTIHIIMWLVVEKIEFEKAICISCLFCLD